MSAIIAQRNGVIASRLSPVNFRLACSSRAALAGDFATTPDDPIFSQTTQLTIAFKVYVPQVGGLVYSLRGLLSQWDWAVAGTARLAITLGSLDANSTFAVFIGNGVDNTTVASATAQNNSLPRGADTEILIAYDGFQVGNPARLRLFSRPVTPNDDAPWVESVNAYGGTVPAALPNTAATLDLARWKNRPGNEQHIGHLWDVRWFSTAVIPAGTSPPSLATCVERWRFREGTGATARGELAGRVLTLSNSLGGGRRPGWRVDGWRGGSVAVGRKILPVGDSKTDGTLYDGAWRVEFRNRMTGFHRQAFQFVGRFTDAAPPPGFFNTQHTALTGTWLDDGTANDMLSWIPVDVAAFDPEILLLLGGTNDIANGASAATAIARLGACIDAAFAAKPTLKIRVISDPPVNTAYSATQADYASQIPGLCAAKKAGGINVECIDVAPRLSVNDLGDAIHQAQPGYEKAAEIVCDAIVLDLAA